MTSPGNLPINTKRDPSHREMQAVRHSFEVADDAAGFPPTWPCRHCRLTMRAAVHR
jgi:hypothetical protein